MLGDQFWSNVLPQIWTEIRDATVGASNSKIPADEEALGDDCDDDCDCDDDDDDDCDDDCDGTGE